MADREDPPPAPGAAAAGLSAEEAERLSEKFHPSWEAGKDEPPDRETGAPSADAAHERTATRSARPKQDTLVGIAPPSEPPPLPAQPPPSGPVTAGGSPDGPTGIAKVYKPKDDPAVPPVVLTEELQKAEAATAAELEAQRRARSSARRMQTVMNLKAPDLPVTKKKRRSGLWQLLAGMLAGLVVVGAVFKLTSVGSPPAPEPAALETVEPVPAHTAPPELAAQTPAGSGEPQPLVLPAGPASGDSVSESLPETAPRRPAAKKPAVSAAPKKAAAKPSKTVTKDTAPPAAKGGVIVRDTPF